MEQSQSSHHPGEFQAHSETRTQSQSELKPHRSLSSDSNRHTKSLSLPYMTSPIHAPEELSSEEEDMGDECEDPAYSSDEDESMFVKSLPPDFFLSSLRGFETDSDAQDTPTPDRVPVIRLQRSEEREGRDLNLETTACEETTDEVKGKEDRDGLEENERTGKEEDVQQLENDMER